MKENHRRSDDRIKGYVQIEGKKYWVQAYSREELEEKKEEKRREVTSALALRRNVKGGNKTVQEWAEEWLRLYKEGHVNPRYLSDLYGRLRNWVFPVIGRVQLMDVEQKDIQAIMNNLSGMSKSLVDKVYNDTKGLFNQALYNRYILYNPVLGVVKPDVKPPKERRSISDEERDVILEVSKTFNGSIMYLIILYAGLRPGEAAALRLNQVDFEKKIIHVHDAVKSDDTLAESTDKYNGKTVNATRDVFLARELEIAIKEVKKIEKLKGNDFIAHKRRSRDHHTKSSMSSMWKSFRIAMHIQMGGKTARQLRGYTHKDRDTNGKVIEEKRINYSVEKPVDDLVANDLVPYCLRHTFCTDLRERGVSIEEAKDLMGHADISLTASIYSHATTKSIEKARKLYDGENK